MHAQTPSTLGFDKNKESSYEKKKGRYFCNAVLGFVELIQFHKIILRTKFVIFINILYIQYSLALL